MLPTSLFDFDLHNDLIAHAPCPLRDESNLLVLDKKTGKRVHASFKDIGNFLPKDTVLVLNDTKVFHARLFGKKETGARIEILLLTALSSTDWTCLLRPGKRLNEGDCIVFASGFSATVIKKDIHSVIRFSFSGDFFSLLETHGEPPIPPYIKADGASSFIQERYQTVFAKNIGSVAAPTAGFHFSKTLLASLQATGIAIEYITLHVGYGTFKPVTASFVQDHNMHHESYSISPTTAHCLHQYKQDGRPFIAVGTTSTRTLESAYLGKDGFKQGHHSSDLFIYPGYSFNCVSGMITNFHLPKSSLIMLVSALAGLPHIKAAYEEAINRRYRFYSFGDAMLIL